MGILNISTFKDMLNEIKGNAINSFNSALSTSAKNAANKLLYGENGGINKSIYAQVYNINKKPYNEKNYEGIFSFKRANTTTLDMSDHGTNSGKEHGNEFDINAIDKNSSLEYVQFLSLSENEDNMNTYLNVPQFSIKDYLNDRVSWQKGLDSLTGEPGWFYFKIFFKFDTNYGLFGGLFSDIDDGENNNLIFGSQNTAINFLYTKQNAHKTSSIKSRITALRKFSRILSFINCKAPWFFKQVNGLQDAEINLNELTKEKYIDIICSEEAVDMRLTTLLDLYKFVTIDTINQKEILPENLRKFDMSIMIFHTPLRYYQTSFKSLTKGAFKYKDTYDDKTGNHITYKLYQFKNCEFVNENLSTIIGELNDEQAFNLGKNTIRIKYDRVFTAQSNEWLQLEYNDTGSYNDWSVLSKEVMKFHADENAQTTYSNDMDTTVYINNMPGKRNYDAFGQLQELTVTARPTWTTEQQATGLEVLQNRLSALQYATDHKYYHNHNSTIYKSVVDASEDVINHAMRMVDSQYAFGNLYGDLTDTNSKYYKDKLAYENGKAFPQVWDMHVNGKGTGVTHRQIPDYAGQTVNENTWTGTHSEFEVVQHGKDAQGQDIYHNKFKNAENHKMHIAPPIHNHGNHHRPEAKSFKDIIS